MPIKFLCHFIVLCVTKSMFFLMILAEGTLSHRFFSSTYRLSQMAKFFQFLEFGLVLKLTLAQRMQCKETFVVMTWNFRALPHIFLLSVTTMQGKAHPAGDKKHREQRGVTTPDGSLHPAPR